MSLEAHQILALDAHLKAGGLSATFVMPPSRKKKKRDNEEWRIQAEFFRWWRSAAPGLKVWPGLFFHVPNGSLLGDTKQGRIIRAKMLKMAGVVNGVADCFLSVPMCVSTPHLTTPTRWIHGLYIEFKKPGGKPSDSQQEFLAYAMANGYRCHVCSSVEEAKVATLNYLKP